MLAVAYSLRLMVSWSFSKIFSFCFHGDPGARNP